MVEIVERGLRLRFDSGWQAIKFDETSWHRQGVMQQLHAMDVIARQNDAHWWIEIKDCRGYEAENRPRLSPAEPPEVAGTREWLRSQGIDSQVKAQRAKAFIIDEIMTKFRETLISLQVAQRSGHIDVGAYSTALQPETNFKIVLILTWNLPDFKRLAARLQDKLQKALAPYAVDGFVTDGVLKLPGQVWEVEEA